MKIRGSHASGKKKGTPKEYTPEEKVPLAVKEAVRAKAPEGYLWWTESIDVEKSTHQKKSAISPHNFANNSYMAEGKVIVRPFRQKVDRLYPTKKGKFKIQFEDALDSIGVPDIKINKFELNV